MKKSKNYLPFSWLVYDDVRTPYSQSPKSKLQPNLKLKNKFIRLMKIATNIVYRSNKLENLHEKYSRSKSSN